MFLTEWEKDFYSFLRPLKDQKPYEVVKEDGKIVIMHTAIGVQESDVKVELEKEQNRSFLVLQGETKNKVSGQFYKFNSKFSIDENSIEEVEWYLDAGILYVKISHKEPERPQIPIKQSQKLLK